MKALGIIAIVAGILVAGHAMLSDVTVAVPSFGNYGTSDTRVNNLGLMADRQNGLIIGGVLSIIGLILVVASKPPNNDILTTPPAPKAYAAHVSDTRTCPFCAETIKARARVCKHCQRELDAGSAGNTAASSSAAVPFVSLQESQVLLMTTHGIDAANGKYVVAGRAYDEFSDALYAATHKSKNA